MPTTASLLDDLRRLGVAPGDVIMVHASLRRLGLPAPDGAEKLLDALDAVVGPDGTLLMILGTESPNEWVNELPPPERAAALAGAPAFDPLTAPALGEVGAFAEFFRTALGTVVSNNPSGRFAARGPHAALLFRDEPWNDYYGPGSVLEHAIERGAKVLRLGAGLDTVTALHLAEYVADVPDKRRTRWDYVVASSDGPRHVWIECLDDMNGIVDYDDGDDYFADITAAWLEGLDASGHGLRGRVGEAEAELFDMAAIVAFGAAWMTARFGGGTGQER